MKCIAIIPARCGSKGLKDKNIRLMKGKPLMQYSIEAALTSGVYDEVMVSTDSKEYARIAQECGARVPFLRTVENSQDTSSSWMVVKEVIETYREMGMKFDVVSLLQPTSPMRDAEDIRNSFKLYKEKRATAVVSVCRVEHSPLLCNSLNDSLSMKDFIREEYMKARQMLPEYYRVNGAIYHVDIKHLMSDKYLYDEGCFAYIMSCEKSIDIDTLLDFEIAEHYMKKEMK